MMAELVKLFYPDGNYLDESYIIYRNELILCKKAIERGDFDKAIEHLTNVKQVAAYSDRIEYDAPGIYSYTNRWFDKFTVNTSEYLYTGDRPLLLCLADSMKTALFDPLRERSDFQELLSSL